jgi:hypothetical protein
MTRIQFLQSLLDAARAGKLGGHDGERHVMKDEHGRFCVMGWFMRPQLKDADASVTSKKSSTQLFALNWMQSNLPFSQKELSVFMYWHDQTSSAARNVQKDPNEALAYDLKEWLRKGRIDFNHSVCTLAGFSGPLLLEEVPALKKPTHFFDGLTDLEKKEYMKGINTAAENKAARQRELQAQSVEDLADVQCEELSDDLIPA